MSNLTINLSVPLCKEELELLEYSIMITQRYLLNYLPDDRYSKLKELAIKLNNQKELLNND